MNSRAALNYSLIMHVDMYSQFHLLKGIGILHHQVHNEIIHLKQVLIFLLFVMVFIVISIIASICFSNFFFILLLQIVLTFQICLQFPLNYLQPMEFQVHHKYILASLEYKDFSHIHA